MDWSLLLDNLLSPPILFFALGALAVAIGSDLEIPQPIAKFLSIYLLVAIGLHGGHALSESGITLPVVASLGAAALLAIVVPVYSYAILRLKLGPPDAAAIAAAYGSVSAVTFVAATAFLQSAGIAFGGHMVAALALMESPAIIIGVLLLRRTAPAASAPHGGFGAMLRDACFNGSVVLVVGSLLIGVVTGDRGWAEMDPFAHDIFKGMLALFLLDMGLVAAKRFRDLRAAGAFLPAFAIGAPLVNATLALLIARVIGLGEGDALLLTVLAASASYIAVPAAMRLAVPDANPSYYVSMALAITFPFNLVIGIPTYLFVIRAWWG